MIIPLLVFLKMFSDVWIFYLENLPLIALSSTLVNPLSSHWRDTPSQRHTNEHSLSKASSTKRVSVNSGCWFSGGHRFNSPSGERFPKKEGTLLQGTQGGLRGHSRAARSGGEGSQAHAASLSDTIPTRGTTLAPRLPQSPSFCKDISHAFNASSFENQNLTALKWSSKLKSQALKSVNKNMPKDVESWKECLISLKTKESCIIYKMLTFLEPILE